MLEVVSVGVIVLPVAMFGVTVPDQRIAAAPPPVFPVLKCVTVSGAPVPVANVIVAAGDIEPPVPLAVDQPLERATFTRA